ncbi:hypothetical protein GQX73_g4486 [Xylaria multiplex]|uniref:Rhodopsin domain-containing protein n=1 Tax=Xylaria multiplex TaxID=323545 RepID=A0A7C8MS37_9PEZI|nr:hypothetical protein GQX73_g4486 [Xylaria multiplex]
MVPSMTSSIGVWHGAWGFVGATIFLAVLSSLAVALRFWSRWISGLGVYLDDWLTLCALAVHHGFGATIIVAFLADGLGFDTMVLATDERAAVDLLKVTFIGTILYGIGSTLIRLSVILFYFRIFPTKIVRRGGYILAAICVAWFVAIEVLNLTLCKPIPYMWDRSIEGGHCISSPVGVIVPGAFNVVIDAVTVGLPIHEVRKLNLSREKKCCVFAIFCIGGIATAASLARLVSISLYLKYLNLEARGTGATFALLSATTGFEIYIAIIGACAPMLVPVYKRLRGRRTPSDTPIPHRSGYTGKPKSQTHTYLNGALNPALSRTALRESDDEERFFKRLDDIQVLVPAKERGEFWTDISARPGSEGVPLGKIRVQRDLTWKSED